MYVHVDFKGNVIDPSVVLVTRTSKASFAVLAAVVIGWTSLNLVAAYEGPQNFESELRRGMTRSDVEKIVEQHNWKWINLKDPYMIQASGAYVEDRRFFGLFGWETDLDFGSNDRLVGAGGKRIFGADEEFYELHLR